MTEARGSTGLSGTAHPPGTPCWVSLMVHRMTATQEFYGALFGWEFQPGPRQLDPYVRALLDGREVAGIGQLPPDRHLPIAWTPYFASDNVDLTAETVRHCGGTVGVGPLDAGDVGRLAIASDPAGAVFGIWQVAERLGTDVTGVPGTPAWDELLTRDASLVATFYEAAFGYEAEPTDSADLDYITLRVKGHPVAGIRGIGTALPRDRGPHWLTYFETTDPDESTNRVIELGGHVVKPPHDTPQGRVVMVADPEGALFAMVHTEP
ncbi:VOC family protein [Streptomyces ipomoeae]|uniref:VOC family protein n=1 Tax=Streptomyces ipomoeae TaxID=103232 RepID=UPI0011473C1A|nr:VOC family protein [Streptomyces ipomoeae]MDX2819680.1 VOC family protein [Streptomyces ipomoeae]MDX2872369.1 VOC family protein [Streptomyces ipomoeae]TQE22764.1 VOC family protein [Streptomyces ipomoeae]